MLETFESVINKSIITYGSLPTAKRQEDFKTRIAAGYRLYEMESQPRQRVHRGEIWRGEVPTGVGSETTGMRWALVISQKAHTKGSYTFNAVYLDGQAVKKSAWQMEITEADLEYGDLIKETEDNKCRINLTDIYTLDRKRLMDRKGKVNNVFMKKVMTRIASQLGITLDSGCNIEMGPEVEYYFDVEDCYCEECEKRFRVHGSIWEYPLGAYNYEDISVEALEEDDEEE